MVCLSAMLGISPMVCIWGVPHVPVSVLLRSGEQNPLTLPLFGRMPEPQSERRKLFGSPQAPYLRWCVFGRMPKPRGVYGERPMPPRQDVAAIRGAEPNQKDASCLGVPKPHISDGVYLGVAQAPGCIWGAPHAPKTGRCRYSGSRTQSRRRKLFGSPQEPQSERRKLFGSPQAPYLRWRVFGRMPKPRGVYGENPIPPKTGRCRYSGEARTPIRKTQAVWEFPSPISPMACIWELPKPQGVYGEYPMPPRQDAAAIRENARTPIFIFHFSLFNFHFLLHSP